MQQEGKQQQPDKKTYKSAAHQFFANLPAHNNASSSSRVHTSARASSSRQKLPNPSSSSSRRPGASSSSSSSSSSKVKGKGRAKAPVRIIDLTEDDDLPPKPRKKPTKPVKRAIIDLTLSSSEDEKEKDLAANAGSDSDIEIVSSTMASKKSKDLQRERARDKANGLVQARFSFSKDENVMRYATVSPTKKSLPSSPALPLGSSPMLSGRTIQVKRKSSTPNVGGARPQLNGSSSAAIVKGEIPFLPPAPVRRTVTPTSAFSSSFAAAKSSPSHALPSSPTVAMCAKVERQSPRFSASPVKRESPRSPHNGLRASPTKAKTTIRSPSGLSITPSHKHGESATPSQRAAPPTPTTSSATMPVFPLPRHESNPFDVRGSPAAKPPSSLSLPRVKTNVFGDGHEDEAYKPPSNSRERNAAPSGRSTGRARPLPGAYALPAVDTPIHDWPTFQGSSGSTRKRAEKGKGKAAAAEGSARATVSVAAEVKDKPQAEVTPTPVVAAASPARSKSAASQPLLSTPSSSPIKGRAPERGEKASPIKSPVKRSPVKSKSTTSVSTSQMLSPPSSSPGPSVSVLQLAGRDASEEAEPAAAEPVPAEADAPVEEEEKEEEEVPMAIDDPFAREGEPVAPEVEEAETLTSPKPAPESSTEDSTPTLTSDLELGTAPVTRDATPPAPPAPSTPKPMIAIDLAPDSPMTPLPLPSERDLTSLSGRSMHSARPSLHRSTRGLSILSAASSTSTLTQLSATPTKSVYKALIASKGKASYRRGPRLSPDSPEKKRRGQMQVVVEIPAWRDEVKREYTPLVLSPTRGKGKGKGKGKGNGKGKGRLVERKDEMDVEVEPAPEPQMEETEKEEEAKPEEDTWEEMDLDAWDDFDWAAPAPTADGPSMSTPSKHTPSKTPSKRAPSRTPSKRALSRPATPSQATLMTPSRRLLAASGSGSVAGTPRSSSKRALSASPSVSAKKRKTQKPVYDEYQRLFEEEKQKRAKAEEEAAEERAMQRRKEAEEEAAQAEMMALDDEEEEEEADPLASILANIKSPVKPNAGLRVSSRNASMQDARKAKLEEKREAKRLRQAKASEARKATMETKRHAATAREFDALGKEMLKSDAALELMRELDGEDDLEDDGPYPTPAESESIDGDGLSDYGDEAFDEFGGVTMEREPSVGEIVEKMKANKVEIDESLVRDARKAKEKPTDVFTWEGFWEKDFQEVKAGWMVDDEVPVLQAETNDKIVSLLKTYTAAGDTASLSSLVSSGVLSLVDSSFYGAISSWLYDCALASPDAQWAEVATTALIHIFETGKVPLNAVSLNQQIPSVLLYMGARSSLFPEFERVDIKIPQMQNRETACILLCRILKAGLKDHDDDSPVSHLLVPILLLLAIDPTTSKTLRRHIDEAIILLLALDAKPDSPMAARAVAAKIAERTKSYSEDVWSAVLTVLGEATRPARDVSRWLGMAYFWGGSLSNMDNLANPPPIPSVPLVVTSLVPVFNSLREPPQGQEPDWRYFNNLVTFLSSAISDVGMLVELDPSKISKDKGNGALFEEHPVQDIRTLIRRMMDIISDQSDGSHKSLVKGRLHQLLEVSRLVLKLAIKKRKHQLTLGKNLEHGSGGQLKLAFEVKRGGKKEVPVEQAEASSVVAEVGAQEVAEEGSSDVDVNDLV